MASNPMGGFWSRLTPRERTYILVLVLVFFMMGTLVLLYMRDKALRETENEIADLRTALEMVHTKGAVYKEKLEQKREREAKISDESLFFSTLLEEASAVAENVQANNQEELQPVDLGGGLSKRSYKFNLRSVTLEDLVKFLTKIESKPGHIIVTESLLIRSPSNSEDRLNADVTISTWERQPEEGAEGDDKDKKGGEDEEDEGGPS
ncbi:MAG: hypothetical protein H6712_15395 [Myxococcales bacterium]|nr:hypothetical protein [Myxococcales bacterium]MCB9715251.1 hypothetical protein [Myxococcales bacterium]